MYSKSLEKKLKALGIGVGDQIRLEASGSFYDGRLMPRGDDSDNLVIKLENGYNIGINATNAKISLIKKREEKKETVKQKEEANGEITILGCGGTISSKVEYLTGAVYPALDPAELKKAFPEMEKIASVKARSLFSLLSEDVNSTHWKMIAEEIIKEIKTGAKGIVLMHGTDTMHYTSAAISFMIQNPKVPIIFVGAQRSADRPSSENEMNLLNAVYAAKSDLAEVGICMHATTNDDYCFIHRGTRVRKMHSSTRDAFKSINTKPLMAVDYRAKRIEKLNDYAIRGKTNEMKVDLKINSNVAMIYLHPNIKPKLIKSLDDYDGVVLVGTGLGNAPTNPFGDRDASPILKEIHGLTSSGISVVMSSQTIYGRLNMHVYTAGRLLMDAGVIGDGMDWTPETAYVKLCHALGRTKDLKKVRELMETNMVGEISERSVLKYWEGR
ncbi:Glu-tRNA(Gln) amidotransferase subunit GatD [Candidatus Micrarchaeota archaeon]|nr:Glu-tRNA(Gln) amidotransferase subunit GatD [Candidatus Micrarchaeota archaeon]